MSALVPLQIDTFVLPPIHIVTGYPQPERQWWQPITSTLIHGSNSAVLVDPPITIDQSNQVADWVDSVLSLYPNKTLEYIYITHAHGDHFFGSSIIQKRFPTAETVTTATVAGAMSEQYSHEVFDRGWAVWFPDGQLPTEQVVATALPLSNEFTLDGHTLKAYDVSSDCAQSTVLHIPSLNATVVGDVVYGDCFQYLVESNTDEKRQRWLSALDLIEGLQPSIVVASHKRATQIDGPYLVGITRKYILDFARLGNEVKANSSIRAADKPEALFTKVKQEYPNRWNDYLLIDSATAFFVA